MNLQKPHVQPQALSTGMWLLKVTQSQGSPEPSLVSNQRNQGEELERQCQTSTSGDVKG